MDAAFGTIAVRAAVRKESLRLLDCASLSGRLSIENRCPWSGDRDGEPGPLEVEDVLGGGGG